MRVCPSFRWSVHPSETRSLNWLKSDIWPIFTQRNWTEVINMIHVYPNNRNNNDHNHHDDHNDHNNHNETTKKRRRIFVSLPNLFSTFWLDSHLLAMTTWAWGEYDKKNHVESKSDQHWNTWAQKYSLLTVKPYKSFDGIVSPHRKYSLEAWNSIDLVMSKSEPSFTESLLIW